MNLPETPAAILMQKQAAVPAAKNGRLWENTGTALFALLIISKVVLFFSTRNIGEGFDITAHLEMIRLIDWLSPHVNMHTVFYGYHPPLAFLLARGFYAIGLSEVGSVQHVNFIAVIVALIAYRNMLRSLHLFREPGAVLFLAITFALPLVIFLQKSVNMDALIFAFASLVLSTSVQLWMAFERHDVREWRVELDMAIVITALALALMTKFNAILLLPIPFIAALVLPLRHRGIALKLSVLAACAAVAIVSPYYYTRYYVPEHTFFPSNAEMQGLTNPQAQDEARAQRDAHPVLFITNLFLETQAHATGAENRDLQMPRLIDTWKDVWMRDDWLTAQEGPGHSLSLAYLAIMPLFIVSGAIMTLQRLRKRTLWDAIGMIFIWIALLQIAFLILYIYKYPWAGGVPSKALYITPALWAVGYLLSQNVYYFTGWTASSRSNRALLILQGACIGGTAAFILLNHLIPVY